MRSHRLRAGFALGLDDRAYRARHTPTHTGAHTALPASTPHGAWDRPPLSCAAPVSSAAYSQVMNKLRVGHTEQPFTHGAEARVGRRPRLLRAFIASQEQVEIDAVELAPAVDDNALRKASVATDAFSHDHHA